MNRELKAKLKALASDDQSIGINEKFSTDAERAEHYAFDLDSFYIDFSKTHISKELIEHYQSLAHDISFEQARHNLFSGEKINNSEDRAVLHTLLRDSVNQGIEMRDPELLTQAAVARDQFFSQYELIQEKLAQRSKPIEDIIHVGIGGSALGTQLLFESLVSLEADINIHFIGNIDAHQLVAVLQQCKVDTTLVIGVSKTFSTAETLQNLDSIGAWFAQNKVSDWRESYYAVTANPDKAADWGIPSSNVVSFPKWVGGRYSVWSSVSLSAALVLGIDKLRLF